jgi:hypothetical protein
MKLRIMRWVLACGIHGREDKCIQVLVGNRAVKRPLRRQTQMGGKILKWILNRI